MSIEIIGAESLGVRGLCCLVTLPDSGRIVGVRAARSAAPSSADSRGAQGTRDDITVAE